MILILVILFSLNTAAEETAMTFEGKRIKFTYESGLEVIGSYQTETMEWEALTGEMKGAKDTEKIQTGKIAPGIFFVNWVEKKGTSVSQVLNFNEMKVTAFVTFETPQGRQGVLDRGTFELLK